MRNWKTIDDLIDDPDFVGLVAQKYHTLGDEQLEAGNSVLYRYGEHHYRADSLAMLLGMASPELDVFPVFR